MGVNGILITRGIILRIISLVILKGGFPIMDSRPIVYATGQRPKVKNKKKKPWHIIREDINL